MDISEIAAIGYAIAGLLFLLLAVLLLTRWRDQPKSPLIALAALFTAFWGIAQFGSATGVTNSLALGTAIEIFRCLAWAVALILFLRSLGTDAGFDAKLKRYAWILLATVGLVSAVLAMQTALMPLESFRTSSCLVLGATTLILCEQLFRNSPTEPGSGLHYFCLAVAGMFLYDIAFFGLGVVENALNEELWAARGFVNGLLAVPLFYAVRKRFNLAIDSLVPRQVVFYSFALIGVGVLLATIYAGDFAIRRYGGSWADVLRIVFFVAMITAAGILLVSSSFRAKARVFMMKALFQYKYDYRREWLRFIATLSQSGPEQHVPTTAVRAIAQIVNSPGGVVWIQQQDDEDYVPVGSWNCEQPIDLSVNKDSALIKFLTERQWVIDLDEMKRHPERYDGHSGDDLPGGDHGWWLLVPILLGDRLSGFITLLRPRDIPVLTFEDHDLLKTAGRHVATHIEQAESDRRLAEASQFGAYNRLTAFLMHDLSNLLAQQSLVVENAERFGHNPEFIDDAIGTISHSVTRMRRLMEQLSSVSKPPTKRRVNLCSTIDNAVERTAARQPVPVLTSCDLDIHVQADSERLSMVFEHLLRNAQEATPPDGEVRIAASASNGVARISITDTGSGMTREFIRTRLFTPFDSTKGSQGMGIGVYQAREYARSLGGQLEVTSEPDSGTEFVLHLPLG